MLKRKKTSPHLTMSSSEPEMEIKQIKPVTRKRKDVVLADGSKTLNVSDGDRIIVKIEANLEEVGFHEEKWKTPSNGKKQSFYAIAKIDKVEIRKDNNTLLYPQPTITPIVFRLADGRTIKIQPTAKDEPALKVPGIEELSHLLAKNAGPQSSKWQRPFHTAVMLNADGRQSDRSFVFVYFSGESEMSEEMLKEQKKAVEGWFPNFISEFKKLLEEHDEREKNKKPEETRKKQKKRLAEDPVTSACEKLKTIPQFDSGGTCWFNALLTTVFFSDGMRKVMASVVPKLKLATKSKKKLEIFKILEDIIAAGEIESNAEQIKKFYESLKPENIIKSLYATNKTLFYFDQNRQPRGGHQAEVYLVQLLEFLRMKERVLFLVKQNNKHYFSRVNLFRFEGRFNKRGEKINLFKVYKQGIQHALHEVNKPKSFVTKKTQIKEREAEREANRKEREAERILLFQEMVDDFDYSEVDAVIVMHKEFDGEGALESPFWGPGVEVDFASTADPNTMTLPDRGHFKIDGLLLSNFNSDACNKSHQISGVSCNGKRYMYNGWLVDNQNKSSCSLFEFDWMKNNKSFCIDREKCNFGEANALDMCFNIEKNASHVFVFDPTREVQAAGGGASAGNAPSVKTVEDANAAGKADDELLRLLAKSLYITPPHVTPVIVSSGTRNLKLLLSCNDNASEEMASDLDLDSTARSYQHLMDVDEMRNKLARVKKENTEIQAFCDDLLAWSVVAENKA